jgi:hypothetical protein
MQADFLEQRSMIAETIEDAGHPVIFCPKYHCELNFIEFFWGASRSIFVIIVIILLKASKRTCRLHSPPSHAQEVGAPHDSVDGCHTVATWVPKRLSG